MRGTLRVMWAVDFDDSPDNNDMAIAYFDDEGVARGLLEELSKASGDTKLRVTRVAMELRTSDR